MAITLEKGEGISLSKDTYDLSQVTLGLGWDVAQGGEDYDLDAIAFLVGHKGKVNDLGVTDNDKFTLLEGDVVFYNSQRHPSGHVWLTGDNRTGAGNQEDDEQIIAELDQLDASYERIVLIVQIYKGIERNQHFDGVRNAFVRAVDARGREICRYRLSTNPQFSRYRSIKFAELVRQGSGWQFRALGEPYETDRFVRILKEYL